jgi:peptide deformylase
MSILKIRKFPDPILRMKAYSATTIDSEATILINDMIETLYSFPGCVGIAANQVGKLLRVIVVDTSVRKKQEQSHGLIVCVNPLIIHREGEQIAREGCLSIPDYTGNVKRAAKVIVQGLNQTGETFTIMTEGFEAVAFQHEIDHLDGILFIDRVSALKTDIFRRKRYR